MKELDLSPRAGWYLLPTLRPGRPTPFHVGDLELVAFEDGRRPAVVSAHCPHMGIHLSTGPVAGGVIQCPLHGWTFDREGQCLSAPGWNQPPDASLCSYRVEEHSGLHFVALGELGEPAPAPALWAGRKLRFLRGRPLVLAAPWTGIAANGFDAAHLLAVHRRRVAGEPAIEKRPELYRVRYDATVEGTTLADAVTRAISGGIVENVITAWGGGLLVVESRVGTSGAILLLGLRAEGGATEVSPVFGIPCRGALVDPISLRVARWLFQKFLERDVQILIGMRFAPRYLREEDRVLAGFLDYLHGLPVLSPASRPSSPEAGAGYSSAP